MTEGEQNKAWELVEEKLAGTSFLKCFNEGYQWQDVSNDTRYTQCVRCGHVKEKDSLDFTNT